MSTERADLPGGTTVLVESHHAIPLVSIVVALRSGAALDPDGRSGLSRVVARMLRRGCEGLTAHQIEDAIDSLGGEMAVDTSPSSVAIHAQVIGRNLDAFVELLARLLRTPLFPEDQLERLKRETVAEIVEARDNDRVVAQKAFQRAMYPGHPYGRNAGGTTSSVQTLTPADVRDHFRKHFVKGNVVVSFAGDVERDRAVALAERLVEGLPPGAAVPDPTPDPVVPSGRRLLFVDKPERTQTQVLIGSSGTWAHDPDHVALSVGNAVFGGTFTSRLMKEVRSKRGWSYGAYSRLGIDRRRTAFSMWTFPGAEDAAACVALEIELLEALLAAGVTAEETEFMKNYLVRSHAFDIDTANKRLHQALDTEVLGLPSDYYTGWLDHVRAVTSEEATRALTARIHPGDLLVTVVGTASDILDDVRKAIPQLGSAEVVPYDAE